MSRTGDCARAYVRPAIDGCRAADRIPAVLPPDDQPESGRDTGQESGPQEHQGRGPEADAFDETLAEPVELGDPQPAPNGPDPYEVRPPVPAVDAERLGLHGGDRWVYREVSLLLPQGCVLAISGPKGSGRSTLLLTLTGRMRATDGRLTVFGYPLPVQAKSVRRLACVARVGTAVALEPRLSVEETVQERALLTLVPSSRAQEEFARACDLLDLDLHLHRHALVEDLPGVDQTLLATAVALVGAPAFVVVDDVDAGLHSHEEARVWRGLRALAEAGVTVAATTSDPGPADGYLDVGLRLNAAPSTIATKGRFR
jgi:ABC-2 type transport system ATP-binding protein